MAAGTRRTGEFCWFNMITPRPEEACAFFGAVLGWTFFEMPGMGYGVRVGGRDVGGLFDQNGPNTPPGTPAFIGVMVKVDDADAVAAKVTALGGSARPAFDIMNAGRMAVCFDPNGAEFDIWQPKTMHGTDVDTTLHGAPSWFETMTTDVRRATAFYSGLFGWTPEVMPMPGFEYTNFTLGDALVAGLMPILPEMRNTRPRWATYFTVDDADEAARQAAGLGATICVPPQDIPAVGRFCGITSPQGVTFYVIRYTR
jgi:predicted enzyme related to lactoylglutathione lyase